MLPIQLKPITAKEAEINFSNGKSIVIWKSKDLPLKLFDAYVTDSLDPDWAGEYFDEKTKSLRKEWDVKRLHYFSCESIEVLVRNPIRDAKEQEILKRNRGAMENLDDCEVLFEYNGDDIVDPYKTSCGRHSVDPVQEYGDKYIMWYMSLKAKAMVTA